MNIEELCEKYNINSNRANYLLDTATLRLGIKHPFKYIFQYDRQEREAYRLIDRYLAIQKARDDRIAKLSEGRNK